MNKSTLFVDVGNSPAIRSLRRQTDLYKESKEEELEKVKKFLIEIVAVSKDYFKKFKPEDPFSRENQVSIRFSGENRFCMACKRKEINFETIGHSSQYSDSLGRRKTTRRRNIKKH